MKGHHSIEVMSRLSSELQKRTSGRGEAENDSPLAFRWVMLSLSFIGGFSQGFLWLSSVPLVLAVERDLKLTAAQVAIWLNVHLALTVLFSIPVGLVVDRWGSKQVGRLGVTLMAVGAMARGFAASYNSLLGASAAFGLGFITFFICLPKSLARWFPPREIGMATGIFMTGYGFGSALGLSLVRPIFGDDWQSCFRNLGWVGIGTAACWWLFARDPHGLLDRQPVVVGESTLLSTFKAAFSTRMTWLLTMIFFCYAGAFSSWFTFGFPFLVRYRHFSENSAGVLLTMTMAGYTAAAVTMPWFSDWLRRRRLFFLLYSVLAVCLFLGLLLRNAPMVAKPFAILIGTCFGTINPLIFTVAAEAKELGAALMGASVGIISSLGSVAGFLVPIVDGKILGAVNSASEQAFDTVWLMAAVCASGIFICGLLLKETGPICSAFVVDRDS
jgi:MFS transporter, ACS family, hexuronate transporter